MPPPPKKKYFGIGWGLASNCFGNDLLWGDLTYSEGFMKFGCPEPSKIMFDFEIFVVGEAFDSVFTGPAL